MKYSPGELAANRDNWFFASSNPSTAFTHIGWPSGSFLKMSNFASMTSPKIRFVVTAPAKGKLFSIL